LFLTRRSEFFICGRPDLKETIRRLQAYSGAGAECLYAPGIASLDDIRAIVGAVAPKPVNVLARSTFTVREIAATGARRISVGGAFARAALTAFLDAAKEAQQKGSFTGLGRAVPGSELNALFNDN